MLNTNEEKVWEKPWSNEELKTFSTSWSLAGDAGVRSLLELKSVKLLLVKLNLFYYLSFFLA